MRDFDNLLKENSNYFVNNIEPYFFLLYNIHNEAIVIKVHKSNFGHLIVHEKSSNILYSSMSGNKLYSSFKNGKIKSLFDFIDEERFNNNELTLEENFIYQKNIIFIDIFESLLNHVNLRLYRKIPGDDFDTDYLHVKSYTNAKGYVGIKGGENNDYHYFNSIIHEVNRNEIYRGIPYCIKNVEQIPKKNFVESKYKFVKSKSHSEIKHKKKVSQNKKFNFDKNKNLINKRLTNSFILKTGRYGKNSVQIYKNSECIENHFERIEGLHTTEQIIEYIKSHYEYS